MSVLQKGVEKLAFLEPESEVDGKTWKFKRPKNILFNTTVCNSSLNRFLLERIERVRGRSDVDSEESDGMSDILSHDGLDFVRMEIMTA